MMGQLDNLHSQKFVSRSNFSSHNRMLCRLQLLSPSSTKRLDEASPTTIKFGTNADLSDIDKFVADVTLFKYSVFACMLLCRWAAQLAELQKLPEFLKVV